MFLVLLVHVLVLVLVLDLVLVLVFACAHVLAATLLVANQSRAAHAKVV